jgi:hypothetical protein
MPSTYDLGDSVSLKFTVKVKDPVTGVETLTNATVTLTLTAPDGTHPAASITNQSTGVYTAPVAPDQAGEWIYRWTATGAATTAEDGSFLVEPNLAGTLYATVGELREALKDDTALRLDAGKLEQRLRSASRAVDDWCSRPLHRFWLDPIPTSRTYRTRDLWCASVDDIGSTTGLVVKTDSDGDGVFETTWTIDTDFQLEPLNAAGNGGAYRWNRLVAVGSKTFPYPLGYGSRPTLQVTARHGWSQIPDPVREATLLKAIRLNRRPDAPFGNEAGGLEFGPIRITREDADVVGLLTPYRIPTGFA